MILKAEVLRLCDGERRRVPDRGLRDGAARHQGLRLLHREDRLPAGGKLL